MDEEAEGFRDRYLLESNTLWKHVQTLDSWESFHYGKGTGYSQGCRDGLAHGYRKGWWQGLSIGLGFLSITLGIVAVVHHLLYSGN